MCLIGGGGGAGAGGGARTRPEMHCLPGFGFQLPRRKHACIPVLMFHEMHAGLAEQLLQQNAAQSLPLQSNERRMGIASWRQTPGEIPPGQPLEFTSARTDGAENACASSASASSIMVAPVDSCPCWGEEVWLLAA